MQQLISKKSEDHPFSVVDLCFSIALFDGIFSIFYFIGYYKKNPSYLKAFRVYMIVMIGLHFLWVLGFAGLKKSIAVVVMLFFTAFHCCMALVTRHDPPCETNPSSQEAK
ncbi:hypothetical protein AND_007951 [Anopheles darlingi]|uniref:Uncharacterized protein n=1 Tax=Anopheles darlingi TaxID=43151 RepID=W5J8Z8_ANODA|nr:hypothetical protein AND_007951 [Anopheles darlingi]